MSAPRGAALAAALLALACAGRGELRIQPSFLAALALPAAGNLTTSPAALRGRVVLVSFTATWCLPCLQELADLTDLHRRFEAEGFTLAMVGMDLEGALVLTPFAEYYALPFPLLVADEHLRSGRSAFGPISVLPTSFLIGKDGALLVQVAGSAPAREWERRIAEALRP